MSRSHASPVALVAISLSVVLTACGTSGDAGNANSDNGSPEAIKARLSHHLNATDAFGKMAQTWADDVEVATSGKIDVEVFAGASLVGPVDLLDAVRTGRVEMGVLVSGYNPSELPLFHVTTVPFVGSTNAEVTARAFADLMGANEDLQKEFDVQNVVPMNPIPVTDAILVADKRYETLEDLSGIQVRSLGYHGAAFEKIGATPVSMAYPEIYEALERGTIDAANSVTLTAAIGSSFHEQASVMQTLGFGTMNLGLIIVNKDFWDGLDDDTRATLTSVSQDMIAKNVQILTDADQVACEAATDEDVDIFLMPESEVQRWNEAAGEPVLASWRESAASSGVHEAAAVDSFLADYGSALATYEGGVDYVDAMVACGNS